MGIRTNAKAFVTLFKFQTPIRAKMCQMVYFGLSGLKVHWKVIRCLRSLYESAEFARKGMLNRGRNIHSNDFGIRPIRAQANYGKRT